MAKILIIDDDPGMNKMLQEMVKLMGHESASAALLQKGVEVAQSGDFDVVLLDVNLPDGNGLEALPQIQAGSNSPEVIIITGYGEPDGAELAIKSGAWDYIVKASSLEMIMLPVMRALEYREARKEKQTPILFNRDGIVGNSPQILSCLETLAQAAASTANVLLAGETGTGKELFARALHRNSLRAKMDFVTVDCTALPPTLVESILFGHEKGTFTGAYKHREGLIAQADGGTLFLDEIGELPPAMQKAFLRVLQEKTFRPLGSQRDQSSDFRLVAATNRNLDQMVEEGTFRSDLLFRLRTFAINLPPLRERPDDIRELALSYIPRFCEQNRIDVKGYSPEFLEALCDYEWPGNVRELIHSVEHAVVVAKNEPLLFPKHLPEKIRVTLKKKYVRDMTQEPVRSEVGPIGPWKEYRDSGMHQLEIQYFSQLLDQVENDLKKACDVSGLSLSRLYGLLNKHQLLKKSGN